MTEENRPLPFVTRVLGQEVTVAKVDITRCDQIESISRASKSTRLLTVGVTVKCDDENAKVSIGTGFQPSETIE